MSAETGQIQASFGGTPAETDDAPKAATPAQSNGKSKGRMLTRSMMREVKDFAIQPVQIQTRDGEVYLYVRSLSALHAVEISQVGLEDDGEQGPQNAKRFARIIEFISFSACDEEGKLLFTEPDDIAWLKDLKVETILSLWNAVQDVNGLTKEGLEDTKGN